MCICWFPVEFLTNVKKQVVSLVSLSNTTFVAYDAVPVKLVVVNVSVPGL